MTSTTALAVQPAAAGRNRLTFDLRELGGPHGPVEQFIVRTVYLDDIVGVSEDQAAGGPDLYILEGGQLSLPGKWEIDAVIRRTGQDDVLANFQVTVAK